MAAKAKPIPEGFSSVTPHLVIKDAAKAIEFYKRAFGAKEVGRLTRNGGIIAHCELQIGNSRIMLAEEFPEMDSVGPQSLGGSPITLCLYVENVDEVFNKAISSGAKVEKEGEVKDQFWGDRSGTLVDPYGHRWMVMTHKEDVPFDKMQKRFEEFYASHN